MIIENHSLYDILEEEKKSIIAVKNNNLNANNRIDIVNIEVEFDEVEEKTFKDKSKKGIEKREKYFKFNKLKFDYLDIIEIKMKEIKLTDNYFEFIQFIELIKGFANNRLDTKQTYKINNLTAQIRTKNNFINLYIKLDDFEIYIDKFQCLAVSTYLTKLNQNFNPIYQH